MPEIEDARNGRLPFQCPESSALLGPASVERPVLAKDVRPEFPTGQVRDQVPPINRGAAWIGSKRKAALVGDAALANGSRGNGPGRDSAILLSCTHGTGKFEEVVAPDCVNCTSEQSGHTRS